MRWRVVGLVAFFVAFALASCTSQLATTALAPSSASSSPAATSPVANSLPTLPTAKQIAAAARSTTYSLPGARSFLLHVPPGYRGPLPLIVALPIAFHDAQSMQTQTGLSLYADTDGFAVAFGQGAGELWNAAGCCGGDTANDLAYLTALVARAERVTPIDTSRIYLIGMSNGGMMAYRAICEIPGLFAAAGVVAGALLPDVDCAHTVVHVYEIHGTQDTTVPLNGGDGFEHIDFPAQATDLARTAPGSVIDLQTWDGGHVYPPWATAVLWQHLSQWHLQRGGSSRSSK
jgi:poly(3-hydroxybutyrate) depolymerase